MQWWTGHMHLDSQGVFKKGVNPLDNKNRRADDSRRTFSTNVGKTENGRRSGSKRGGRFHLKELQVAF